MAAIYMAQRQPNLELYWIEPPATPPAAIGCQSNATKRVAGALGRHLTNIRSHNKENAVDAHPSSFLVEEEHVLNSGRTYADTDATSKSHDHAAAQGLRVGLCLSNPDRPRRAIAWPTRSIGRRPTRRLIGIQNSGASAYRIEGADPIYVAAESAVPNSSASVRAPGA